VFEEGSSYRLSHPAVPPVREGPTGVGEVILVINCVDVLLSLHVQGGCLQLKFRTSLLLGLLLGADRCVLGQIKESAPND